MTVSTPMHQLITSVNHWWHSIPVAPGVITPGHKTPEILAKELQNVPLHLVQGKTVLDIGAWDGFFSFAAEAAGASRVVSLDHYVWGKDFGTGDEGRASPYWEAEWPGKIGYNVARALRGSRIESVTADFMAMDPASIGTFDVVFFFGVLYHMRHPLLSL
ncbi:class I SAM-dependent methyltransferase, partial [Gemmatimonas sp.]